MRNIQHTALSGYRTKTCSNKTLNAIWCLFSNSRYRKRENTTRLCHVDGGFTLNRRGLVQLRVKSLFYPFVFIQELRLAQHCMASLKKNLVQNINLKMKKKIILLTSTIVLSLILFESCKKENEDNSSNNKWTIYNNTNGLKSNNVYSIAVESDSSIWIGTDNGVSHLTNDTISNVDYYSLINQTVYSIAIDNYGNKWFGTLGKGIFVLENENKNWVNFNTTNGLADNTVYTIKIDKNNVKWLGTTKGLIKYDGTNWTTYNVTNGLADNNVYSIAIDKDEVKWIGTDGGVSKFDNNNWITYNYNGDKSKGIAGNGVNSILIDLMNIKWFGTWGGLSEFDGSNWSKILETNWQKAGSPVFCSIMDLSGNLWFGSNGWGLSVYNHKTWITYATANGQAISSIRSLAIDSKDNVWLGTLNGLLKFEK